MDPDGIDPALVDFAVLADWMDVQGLPGGHFEDVEPLAGGTQNILVRFRRGGRDYVLRRPPRHLRATSNEALRREVRVLTALKGTDVRAPRVIAACPDETVMNGAVFYLMDLVNGFNPTTLLPAPYDEDPQARHAMGLDAASALAALGNVDHVKAGLANLGRPQGFLERQVGRWLRELDGYPENDGYPGPALPGLDRVAGWLEDHRPVTWRPGIMHGDYHLANLLYSYGEPRVAAIVDWEMCTIGDPLLDLGWLLATWPKIQGPTGGLIGDAGGLPSPGELIATYAEQSDRDLSAITWYTVMACFKLAIILEGTHARACAGMAAKDVGDQLHAVSIELLGRARELISEGHDGP